MSIRSYPHPSAESAPKPRTDFLSVMSFVASPRREPMDQNNSNEKDANPSPMTSPTTSTSSGSSLSPLGLSNATSAHDDQTDRPVRSPALRPETGANKHVMIRHNNVSTVVLSGVSIVCLFIDGKERLCLAQISNTLLKRYSYNEIHNRRVALGITCVQCTPVQLEILRRAGAMPISSRRCGMITKREAERLVKSFLEDTSPPKLPENFAFDVIHDCGWGCRGSFMPSRYNSSRAKCIKCTFCNMYFSPNKFIFHFHRTPESKYNHPDAANFNSWRRHLKLANNDSEELFHCWEDVKAMFNGGSRKRILSTGSSPSSSTPQQSSPKVQSDSVKDQAKKMKFSDETHNEPRRLAPPSGTPYPQYPVFPMPNKFLPFRPPPNHPAFCMQPPYPQLNKALVPGGPDPRMMKSGLPAWGSLPDTMCPPYEMIWAKHLGLSSVENGMVMEPRMKQFSIRDSQDHQRPSSPTLHQINKPFVEPLLQEDRMCRMTDKQRLSAFRPVANRVEYSPTAETNQNITHFGRQSPHDNDNQLDDDSDVDEHVDVDTIDTDDRDSEENNNNKDIVDRKSGTSLPPPEASTGNISGPSEIRNDQSPSPLGSFHNADSPSPILHHMTSPYHTGQSYPERETRSPSSGHAEDFPVHRQVSEANLSVSLNVPSIVIEVTPETHPNGLEKHIEAKEVVAQADSEAEPGVEPSSDDLQVLSKEELQKELMTEMEARRRLEIDCKTIKETFQEQVDKEKQFREEMATQLQIVKEKLCQELDQERQVRFNLQQRLKEAHEALDSFSGKSKTSLPACTDCSAYKDSMLPR